MYDVTKHLGDENLKKEIGLAVFDILEWNGLSYKNQNFENIWTVIEEHFTTQEKISQVFTQKCKSSFEVKALFQKWVQEEEAEGLVVRLCSPVLFKIKPIYHFDFAVIGFTEGINEKKGTLKSMLLATLNEKGEYIVAGKVGTGLLENQRKELFEKFSALKKQSSFLESDNEGLIFQCIEPQFIVEISCLDVLTENIQGNSLQSSVVKYENNSWQFSYFTQGFRLISPVLERFRDDKKNTFEDITLTQITNTFEINTSSQKIKTSTHVTILQRKVYKKTQKDKIMLHKFVLWQTHKERENERYFAYVLQHIDFSTGRKDPLKRETLVSSSQEQIMEYLEKLEKENIKKGWELISHSFKNGD